jgi:hypothetical protein
MDELTEILLMDLSIVEIEGLILCREAIDTEIKRRELAYAESIS